MAQPRRAVLPTVEQDAIERVHIRSSRGRHACAVGIGSFHIVGGFLWPALNRASARAFLLGLVAQLRQCDGAARKVATLQGNAYISSRSLAHCQGPCEQGWLPVRG